MGLVQATEHTEENSLIENREMPILDKPSGHLPVNSHDGAEGLLFVGISKPTKNSLLRDLCVSVVKLTGQYFLLLRRLYPKRKTEKPEQIQAKTSPWSV